jgi:hypothetical protein
MKTLDQLIEEQLRLPPVLPDARKVLGAIPGVIGVGVGFRTRAGRVTDQIVLRVQVVRKRPLGEIPESERIPPVFGGVPTDVTLPLSVRSIQFDKFDLRQVNKKVSTLVGGVIIWTHEPEEGWGGFGTLGCFAALKADPTVKVLLSNQHVLYENRGDTGEGPLVGQPDISCSWCCKTGVIGRTMNGVNDHLVDCAIARLNTKRSFVQKLPGVGKDVNGRNEDLITGVPKPVSIAGGRPQSVLIGEPVRKLGRNTGPTSGVVQELTQILIDEGQPSERTMDEQIVISVVAGRDVYGDGKKFFAAIGDSGAVLINRFNQVVGLIHKAPDQRAIAAHPELAGFAAACQIHHVTDELKIDILTSPDANTKDTPATPSVPTPTGALVPGMGIVTHRVTDAERISGVVLDEIISSLQSSAFGSEILHLYNEHHAEIRQLINHDRKVKVAWHRNSGPAFVAALLGGMRDLGQPIPKDVNELPIELAIRRMAAVLRERGSASLAAVANDYLIPVLELVAECGTIAALLAAINARGDGQ